MPRFMTKCDACRQYWQAYVRGYAAARRTTCPICGQTVRGCQKQTIEDVKGRGYTLLEETGVRPGERAAVEER